ncbi:MAG TPA: sigma factor, partial [Planctomycetaceae bacterium]|nr:sigma factor [Planctomycetaceae bacterium]
MSPGSTPEEVLVTDAGGTAAQTSDPTTTHPLTVAPLVEHFFRHEAARLVSVLTRVFGWRHFDLVEDMVQSTLLDALQAWRVGVPENPSGWLHRVAKNKILD